MEGASAVRARIIAGSFVLAWSSGYPAAKLGVAHAGPFTLLTLRFALAAMAFAALALLARIPMPRAAELRPSIIVGLSGLALQFGGVYGAMQLGASPALSALVIGAMPLGVSALSALLGEAVTPRQWLGMAVGAGGVLLVIGERLAGAHATPAACLALLAGLVGICAGTVYQKRHASQVDLRLGLLLQNGTAAVALAPLAWGLEHFRADGSLAFAGALAWIVLVNSIGGFALWFVLLRSGSASSVAALFYLVPPVTLLMSWVLNGETLTPLAVAGFLATATGVWLGTHSRAANAPR